MGCEAQPERRGLSVIRRHAEADGMIGNTTLARGGVACVRRKNPVRMFWFGDPGHMHGYLRTVGCFFPTDLRSFQRHMRILGRMKRNEVSLIDRVLSALKPVAILRAGADDPLAVF